MAYWDAQDSYSTLLRRWATALSPSPSSSPDFLGEYDNGFDYVPGNIVFYPVDQNYYLRVGEPNTGYPPGTSYWQLLEAGSKVYGPDFQNNTLSKILKAYCERYSIPESDERNFRKGDPDVFVLRKILQVYHAGVPSLPDDSAHSWRPLDSERDILAKILKCLSIEKLNADPQKSFLTNDNDVWCVRKIIGLLP